MNPPAATRIAVVRAAGQCGSGGRLARVLAEAGYSIGWVTSGEYLPATADVVVLSLDDLGADLLLAAIRGMEHRPAVLGVARRLSAATYADLVRRGVTTALPADAADESIVEAVRSVQSGYVVLPVEVIHHLGRRSGGTGAPALTTRDIDLLRSVAAGTPMQTIAYRREVSERTIYRQWEAVLAKLSVTSRAEAVIKAERWGLLEPDTR